MLDVGRYMSPGGTAVLVGFYALVALFVTLLSMKAADHVDALDRKTNLSGGFIGGVMLSAVTSLPELFTSLTSVVVLKQPGLCLGNILGSDLFNITVLAVLTLVFIHSFGNIRVESKHGRVLVTVLACYLFLILNMKGILNGEILKVAATSILIIFGYAVSLVLLSGTEEPEEEGEDLNPLTVRQVVIRFVLVSVGIVVLSIVMSFATDLISDRFHLGKGLAGALFLGIATSLPELVSSVALFRLKAYNIAIGNIVGSNIFNLFILGFVDILYRGTGLYDFSDPKTASLLILGAVGMVCLFEALRTNKYALRAVLSVGIVVCYVLFLIL